MFRLFRPSRQDTSADRSQTVFPTQQLFILALCRICEPIAFMSIFPYVYFMIDSFHITEDDSRISMYAGMVTSAFAFAEFSTGVLWGRLSDLVGRKPILLTGLAGTGLSMIIFGFASSLPIALLARALGGLLNGNIGVLQTTVAEVVKVKEHQPRAYAIMPFVWCLGSIIGSGLGGCLADPVRNYPAIFSRGTIFEPFPFLLPNVVCALVVVFSLIVGVLFLEETHAEKRHRRDYGRELGAWLITKVQAGGADEQTDSKLTEVKSQESDALLQDAPPGYASAESSPRLDATRSNSFDDSDQTNTPLDDDVQPKETNRSLRKGFTGQVILHIVAYGILAFHTISFEQLMPVLLSSKESDKPITLPFKFMGGYELPSSEVGFILSLQGVYQMLAQMVIFPWVVNKIGALRTFSLAAICWGLLYVAVPYLVLLPDSLRMEGLAIVLIVKVTLQSLSYPSNALLLANSAPSLLVLGSINGIAASAASLARAFGPTLAGLIQSSGSSAGYFGLAWWISAVVAAAGGIECFLMKEPPTRPDLIRQETSAEPTEHSAEGRHSYESHFSDQTLVADEDNVRSASKS